MKLINDKEYAGIMRGFNNFRTEVFRTNDEVKAIFSKIGEAFCVAVNQISKSEIFAVTDGCHMGSPAEKTKDIQDRTIEMAEENLMDKTSEIQNKYEYVTSSVNAVREELIKHDDLYNGFLASIISALNEIPDGECSTIDLAEHILKRIIGEE